MKKIVFNVLICFFMIFLCATRSNATINTGCGLADYKAVYQNSSAFSRFQIRWDSKSYKSIAKRAEVCSKGDKDLYNIIQQDRDLDIVLGIVLLLIFCITLLFVFVNKKKAK